MAETVKVLLGERLVCASCSLATTHRERFRGLMGHRELPAGSGLLLRPSGSVHTCFMRFPIDIVFLDDALQVIAVSPDVRPWRVRGKLGARTVLELAAGEAVRHEIRVGNRLELASPSNIETKEQAHALC